MFYTPPVARIGVRELNQHTSRYVGRVKDGETVEVTEHGRLVALLVPVPRTGTRIDDLVEEGRVHPPSQRGFPARRPTSGRRAGEDLISMRDEERY
jgi:prevent-host-death family protein